MPTRSKIEFLAGNEYALKKSAASPFEQESSVIWGMIRRLQILLVFLQLAALTSCLQAQPLAGSQTPPEENMCAMCHGASELWEGERRRFYVSAEQLAQDIHWTHGVVCHDCHGGEPRSEKFATTHLKDAGFRATAEEVKEACARCHRDKMIDVTRRGVHAKGGPRDRSGARTPLGCSDCHGNVKHDLLPSQDPRSPVFLNNQYETCGACHEKELQTYLDSVHSPKLVESGSVPTASCADCHGAHGIYRAPDKRSLLFTANVATTCEECHPGIAEKLRRSVHGPDYGGQPLPQNKQASTCTTCHQRHEPSWSDATDGEWRGVVSNGCGICHAKLASEHAMRLHAEWTETGYVRAAECAECHGAHEILPLDDPESCLAGPNRQRTCQECHSHASAKFSAFDPHVNFKDAENYPRLHGMHARIEGLIFVVLVFFGIHTCLWLLRSLVQVLKYGRHKRLTSDQRAIRRYTPLDRIFHATVILSLMGLAATGLPLKYSEQDWAQTVARAMGGFQLAGVWHRVFAVLMLGYSAVYVVWLWKVLRKFWHERWRIIIFGPDSPVLNVQDVRDLLGMFRWFFGFGDQPRFERWTYWEKFDYWSIVFIVVCIGTSGLIMWWPSFFGLVLSGAAINMAQMIHSEIALVATSLLLAIHYFNTHFRPEKFPMDLSILTGLVSEEHLEWARPKFLERMRRQGKLDELRTTLPSQTRLWALALGGGLVHLLGLVLLLAILFGSLGG